MSEEKVERPEGPKFPWWVWIIFLVLFVSFGLEMLKGPVGSAYAASSGFKQAVAAIEKRTSWPTCDLGPDEKVGGPYMLIFRVKANLTLQCDPPDDATACPQDTPECAKARAALVRKAKVIRQEIRVSTVGFGG